MEANAADPGAHLRARGWRQGSVVDEPDLKSLGYAEADIAVVLSQSCDLVQHTDQEPLVELLLGRRAEKLRGDLANGRNPRLLDLPLMFDGIERAVAFRAQDRVFLQKVKLANLWPSPSKCLPKASLLCLIGWVAKRYTRAAFPDAFNERLEQVEGRLDRLVKNDDSRTITGIYVLLAEGDQELPPEVNYRAVVWLAVDESTMKSTAAYKTAQAFESRLRGILESCPGITLNELELRSETDITIADLRRFKRLDMDYRSLAPKPGGASPPPGV